MQFLRSIKSAKAFGLAATTAATMLTASVAPSMAQTPATKTVTIRNAGFYNADFFITHATPRQTTPLQAINLPLNQSRSFQVPLSVSGTVITVTMRKNIDRRVFFQQNFLVSPNSNLCFQADGTVFNPSGRLVRC